MRSCFVESRTFDWQENGAISCKMLIVDSNSQDGEGLSNLIDLMRLFAYLDTPADRVEKQERGW
jgi:hypothetical protein